ncbi:unnamed protein product, partial [Strongylus vulgaris]
MAKPIPCLLSFADENNRVIVEHACNKIFDRPQVMMRDREYVKRKLRDLVKEGKERLMVISDFDYTLSRFEDAHGGRCWTTHNVFDYCTREFDPKLAAKFKLLWDKYFPI